VVTTAAGSPGTLISIELILPPNMHPWYMPTNSRRPDKGSIPKVRGSSRAIPVTGPSPGSAPTIVPSVTPTKPQNRRTGSRDARMPEKSVCRSIMLRYLLKKYSL